MSLAPGQQDRWRRLTELFDSAAELPPDKREAFLDAAGCDSSMRQDVHELFQELEASSGLTYGMGTTAVPDRIGRYLVLEQLGQGGMGQVFVGQDTELDRRVALKFLAMESVGGKPALDFLVREARALSALNHPNIVTVYEVIQADNVCAIAMELVDGVALRMLAGSALPLAEASRICRQIALALAAAHARGIVHRDIKPENILVRPDGYVKVLDFGLARRIGSGANATSAGMPAGTLRYMSPEQTRGDTLSGVSDVFSLGLVFYELATGRHPFADASALETAYRIATAIVTTPSALNHAVSQQADDLILSMLAKEPAARPSAANVASLLGEEGSAGRFVPPREQNTLSRRWLLGACALALPGIGAGAYWWIRSHPAAQPVRVLLDQGEADHPVFSPDGSRVAFTWKPRGERVFKLALLPDSGGTPRSLTSGRVSDVDPVWAPDGKKIGFVRQGSGENAVYLTEAEDLAERRITTLYNSAPLDRINWLSDSRTVVVAENWYSMPMFLVDTETGGRRNLPAPPEGASDSAPKCSPDGKLIAFRRSRGHTNADIHVVGVNGGPVRRVTFDGAAKAAYAWMPDSRGILFKSRYQNRWRLWYVELNGGRVKEVALPQFAAGLFDVRAGRDGRVDIINADEYQVSSISRIDIPENTQKPALPVRMIASEDRGLNFECNPAISPDGMRLAFVSTRTGCPEIWMSDREGRFPRQLTSFGGPDITQPAWSPDGRYILSACATASGRNLLLLEIDSTAMRWLTADGKEETEPRWSRDGRWITFASSRSGHQELWRMPAAGGPAQRLTQNGGAVHRESPDGRWIYFVRHEEAGLWRIPRDGGKEQLVLGRVASELYRAWAVGRKGIYYTYKDPSAAKWTILLLDPESRSERVIAVLDRPLPRWSGALDVAPDERWMVIPMIETHGSRLVLFSGVRV